MKTLSAGMLFLVCVAFSSSVWADTTINEYTFSDDSTEIYMNPFFSEYDRVVDFLASLYGYGDYAGYSLTQTYHQEFALNGIACIVVREDIDIPPSGTTSADVDVHNIYYYYAKDTEDNIHVLQAVYYGDETMGWTYSDLPEGKTSLKYPADPVPDQEVFFGHVAETGKQVGDISGCSTIVFDALPWTTQPITEYLVPASGILAMSHNWDGSLNGYSTDGGAPEHAEEEKSTWEEWLDDKCFISACSP